MSFLANLLRSMRLESPSKEFIVKRAISSSATLNGKRNFRRIFLANKRGTKQEKQMRSEGLLPHMPFHTDVKDEGFMYQEEFIYVREMIPELVVPDLTGCPFKPYVSYQTREIVESEFTPQKLFDAIYKDRIDNDFKKAKEGDEKAIEQLPKEWMTPDAAWEAARKTGSDIFTERIPERWECLEPKIDENWMPVKKVEVKS